jgi:hypothetical protein
MTRKRNAIRVGAIAILGMLAAALIAIIGIAAFAKRAAADPLVLQGEEAQRACKSRCDGTDYAFVDRDTLLQLLRDRESLREERDEAQAALRSERAKPRCSA